MRRCLTNPPRFLSAIYKAVYTLLSTGAGTYTFSFAFGGIAYIRGFVEGDLDFNPAVDDLGPLHAAALSTSTSSKTIRALPDPRWSYAALFFPGQSRELPSSSAAVMVTFLAGNSWGLLSFYPH